VPDQTKDGNDDFLLHVGRHLGGHGADCSMRVCARCATAIYDHYFPTQEERLGPQLLSDITELTGGRAFSIGNPNGLAEVATKMGIELRNQYVLGYRPANPVHDGMWHKILVKLAPPKGLPPLRVLCQDRVLCQFGMITFRGFLWKRKRPCSAAPSEPSAGVRSLDIAIGYGLPVNHLPWYCITDGEPAGRYLDTRPFACLVPPGLHRFQGPFSVTNLAGVLGIRRDVDS